MAHILVFAFDLTEASQIRRIQSFLTLGHTVTSVSFRRTNMNKDFKPSWPNVDLGQTENERHGKRLLAIIKGFGTVLRNRNVLRDQDVIVARNLDLLVIAWLARLLIMRRDLPLVYECLDIHGLFTKPGAVGRVMRWAERRLLARIQLLLVSSHGFIAEYFEKRQGYHGPFAIVENKLWFDDGPLPRPTNSRQRDVDTPLVLGWVGSIRCAPSLAIVMEAADKMGQNLRVKIHGNVHRHALPGFDEAVACRSNVAYFGPYSYPTDLAQIYQDCDLVWAQDLWQRGANSDWLLPNRIYEASWFGCPSVAVGDTETGRRVAADLLGFTIAEPTATALVTLLEALTPADIATRSQHILDIEKGEFELTSDDVGRALAPVLPVD